MTGSYRRLRLAPVAIVLLVAAVLVAIVLEGVSCGDAGGGGSDARLSVLATPQLRHPLTVYGSAQARKQAIINAPRRGYADPDEGRAKLSFASSAAIGARIRKGATPDVVVGDATVLDALYTAGLVEEPIRFGGSKSDPLVIGKRPHETRIATIADIERKGVELAIAAAGTPLGVATRAALGRLPASSRRAILTNVHARAATPQAMIRMILDGRVDAGIMRGSDQDTTCCSDLSRSIYSVGLPTSAQQPPIQYAAAIVHGTKQEELAKTYLFGLLNGNEPGATAMMVDRFGAPPPIAHRPRKPTAATAKTGL